VVAAAGALGDAHAGALLLLQHGLATRVQVRRHLGAALGGRPLLLGQRLGLAPRILRGLFLGTRTGFLERALALGAEGGARARKGDAFRHQQCVDGRERGAGNRGAQRAVQRGKRTQGPHGLEDGRAEPGGERVTGAGVGKHVARDLERQARRVGDAFARAAPQQRALLVLGQRLVALDLGRLVLGRLVLGRCDIDLHPVAIQVVEQTKLRLEQIGDDAVARHEAVVFHDQRPAARGGRVRRLRVADHHGEDAREQHRAVQGAGTAHREHVRRAGGESSCLGRVHHGAYETLRLAGQCAPQALERDAETRADLCLAGLIGLRQRGVDGQQKDHGVAVIRQSALRLEQERDRRAGFRRGVGGCYRQGRG
jgi:hypothetical protein